MRTGLSEFDPIVVAAGTVDLRLRSTVSGLLRDASGRVTGIAVTPLGERGAAAGEPYEIFGAATLLATGGYGANRQLVARLLPPGCGDALSAGFPGATGDGLILAEKVGAALTSYGYYIPTMGLIPDPDRPGFACDHTEASANLVPSVRPPHEVWVNLRGERFVAEDVASPETRERALLQQPGLAFAIVWDQDVMDTADPSSVPLNEVGPASASPEKPSGGVSSGRPRLSRSWRGCWAWTQPRWRGRSSATTGPSTRGMTRTSAAASSRYGWNERRTTA